MKTLEITEPVLEYDSSRKIPPCPGIDWNDLTGVKSLTEMTQAERNQWLSSINTGLEKIKKL